ncbi:exosortase/archaeosortase family protein [Pelagibius marinus]|uniref:exosortase/archaeosortase family protein n=1 Tax=Pelagibius marinus TaxID=2762760 RepID=UPI001872F369|nr:exosortase/archaeosortase family protein [Pelagibius marinus]
MSVVPHAKPEPPLARRSTARSPGVPCKAWFPTLLGIGLALLAFGFAFHREIAEITDIWSKSKTYNFGWIVMPTAAFLLWTRRHVITRSLPRASLWGPALAVAASALWLAGDILAIAEVRHFALAAALLCLTLAVCGAGRFRQLLPCLLLVPFIVPTGQFLLLPLRHLAIEIVAGYSALVGLDFTRDGFTFFVDQNRYVIVDDCAGLSYLIVGAMLGVTFGALSVLPLWRVVTFAVLGAVLGVVANAARIVAIVSYDYLSHTQMELAAHHPFEILSWVLLLVLLLALHAHAGRKSEPQVELHESTSAAPSATAARNLAVPLTCALILVSGPLLTSNPGAAGTPAPAAPSFPEVVGRWALDKNAAAPWHPRVRGGLAQSLAVYSDVEGGKVSLFLVRAERREQKFSDYKINFMGSASLDDTWIPARRTSERLCAKNTCYEVVHETYVREKHEDVRRVYWLYRVGRETAGSLFLLRLRRALADLRGETASAEMVALMTQAPNPQSLVLDPEEVVAFLLRL